MVTIDTEPLMDNQSHNNIQTDINDINSTNEIDNADTSSLQAVISNNTSLEENLEAGKDTTNNSQNSDPILIEYHSACQAGDLVTIKRLVESHAITIGQDFDPIEKVTGLHWAAINNRLSIVEYLLKQGADPNFKSSQLNATPLHWAARYGYVYIVDYLLKNSDADATLCDDQGFNVLHLAVTSSNIMLVCYILYFVVDTGLIDVDCRDLQNRTPLIWAAYQGDPLTVSMLLKFGANVKLVDDSGFTALHWGVVKGQVQVLKHLIKEGQADFFAKTMDGKNCFDIANELNKQSSLRNSLLYSGFDENGYRIKSYLKNDLHAKTIMFFAPLILMIPIFVSFQFLNPLFVLLFGAVISLLLKFGLNKFVLPTLIINNKSPYKVTFSKSPLVAGIFFNSLIIVSALWFWKMIFVIFSRRSILSLLLSILIIMSFILFMQLIQSNPGIIETEKNHDVIRSTITDLLSIGHFDTNNFCIETQVRKPIRSKYSSFQQHVITRFDHFCPWIYNDVGFMNHKKFVWFVTCVEIAIIIFIKLSFKYFDIKEDYYEVVLGKDAKCYLLGDDELCFGYQYDPTIFLANAWSALQLAWVTMLFIIQWVQIIQGVTNYEFILLSKRRSTNNRFNEYFNSAPEELLHKSNSNILDGDANGLDDFNDTVNGFDNDGGHNKVIKMNLYYKIIGMESWIRIIKDRHKYNDPLNILYNSASNSTKMNKIDYWTNIKDFWLDGDYKAPLWLRLIESPKDNKGLLNGHVVDYSKLYDLSNMQNPEDLV
ncbi:palmitoyltransferase AKR1 PWA37_000281 [Arxiozyma heterogenica]|uniref:Palmitoyltransferase n=1 Tax=Arxiozyma heterogenica TaxID=278026 RepID=A0AAN7WHV7_9SACH|nr:hypothetical protein RI543_004129 [Kazachstania heterogenica]